MVTTNANDALSRIRRSPGGMWSTGRTKMIIFCSRLVCTHRAGPPLRVWLWSVLSGIRTMQWYNSRQKVGEVFISALFIRIITDGECQGGITCGSIDEPRKSSKAIDECVVINFLDKNVVIARFRDKNVY